ncbi:acyl-coenzyme A diphosphatase NUDT19-like [Leguminivora glycinivorella]|uniref:acyl-coenzyme A diphosphatase NUDT19-like n=1 Tax=Leguminivora glycinivorella TaxID=1035111 RepID=UPI00200E6694|nr:acyl-coenzyme A diphosphatase NUDT19-like [Leguminivora glycinivorella]
MNNVIRTSWRDAATLIVLSKKKVVVPWEGVNYDILFQTRTASASFANSVVFPGGVTEPSDASDEWLKLFRSFGYSQRHFEAFHSPGAPVTPILRDNPVKRHIALRITAIRETFEELGLLLASTEHQRDRSGLSASVLSDLDVKLWQSKISKNPEDLLTLCKSLGCYPDIWSLQYWSNWLTPVHFPKRFDTAFFVTSLDERPEGLKSSNEVVHVQWASPDNILSKFHKNELVLFPPQSYELNRLRLVPDCEELLRFAATRSAEGNALLYPVILKARDGQLHLLPGDELYPSKVDYINDGQIIQKDKTVQEIRDSCHTIHRFEASADKQFVIRNCKLDNHIDMGDRVIPVA